jgi:hypothetical protein
MKVVGVMTTTVRVINERTEQEEELFCVKITDYLPAVGNRLVCFSRVAKVTDRIVHYDNAGDLTVLLDVEVGRFAG